MSHTLVLPVEIKVRELDGKLLLALIACERGFRVVLGDQRETRVHALHADAGVFLSKATLSDTQIFHRTIRANGVRVVALDEEGVVYRTWAQFLKKRIPPGGLECLDRYLTWGPAQARQLAESRPDLSVDIVPTGSSRMDLLRPEWRAFYDEDRDRLRQKYGAFVLVSSNFGAILSHLGTDGILALHRRMGIVTSAADETTYREIWDYKRGLLREFIALLERFDKAGMPTVLRPHPSEDARLWHPLVRHLPRVSVSNAGPAAAWIHAARGVVHQGCTTGVEAFLMGVPAISYEPLPLEKDGFFLPRALSTPARDFDAVRSLLDAPPERRADQFELASQYITGIDGPLASDRIVDCCTFDREGPQVDQEMRSAPPAVFRGIRWRGLVKKQLKRLTPGFRDAYRLQVVADRKFPGLTRPELIRKIERLQQVSGRFAGVRVEPLPGTRTTYVLTHHR